MGKKVLFRNNVVTECCKKYRVYRNQIRQKLFKNQSNFLDFRYRYKELKK